MSNPGNRTHARRAATRVHHRLHPLVAALALGLSLPATADVADPKASPAAAAKPRPLLLAQAAPAEKQLPAVTVSASALDTRSDEMTTPATVLSDEQLVQRRAATLGGTLSGEMGISQTHFGAGASRPVIRGMDAARVRIMSDGAEVVDASTISPDHAVAVEPMLARRIEVLRGPSALAYGGGAVGGVVNVLDERVPTAVPEKGVAGAVELRGASAAREGAAAAAVTVGSGNFAMHMEGLKRYAGDYKVGDGWSGGDKVEGSYNRSGTGSVGASWIGTRGYIGLAYTAQRNDYGLPGHSHDLEGCHAHDDHLHCGEHEDEEEHDHAHEEGGGVPRVDMRSDRWDLRGELSEPIAGFSKARLRAGITDYKHDEIEGEEVATTFRNKSHDVRVELEHRKIAGWRGVLGLQTTASDFSAVGEESYIQPTETRRQALFLLEEFRSGNWRFEAAARQEWQRIDAEGDQPDTRHTGTSLSAGANWQFMPQYSLSTTLSRSQRLPTATELYAEGLHMATRTYERGNASLDKETSTNVDLTLRKQGGNTRFSVSAYYNHIKDFIYGQTLDEHDGLQLIQYAQRDASFTGVEGEIRQAVHPRVGVSLLGDYVRARFDDGPGNRNIPRVPAARTGVRVDGNWQGWEGQVEVWRVFAQDDTADFESRTSGYNVVNIGASYGTRLGGFDTSFYARIDNLTNQLAYAHTSFIKDAAPLPGRNFVLGARLAF
ncbi:MAG: TonB-dependent receptor [Moraxellaceae bacterium]|nr:TonB-dependent receptor [Moraxellaceae bacterium]